MSLNGKSTNPNGSSTLLAADDAGALQTSRCLSKSQLGIWYAQQLDPDSPRYGLGENLEILGHVDRDILELALQRVIDTNDALHLVVIQGDEGPEQVSRPVGDWTLPFYDMSSEPEPREAVAAWTRTHMDQPIDVEKGPVFFFALFKVSTDCYIWYRRVHHLFVDGISSFHLVERTAAIYSTLLDGAPEPKFNSGSCFDLYDQEEAYSASETCARDGAFWQQQLADRPQTTSLSGKSASRADRYHSHTERLARNVVESFTENSGVRLPGLALAAAAFYQARLSGLNDVVIGMAYARRLGAQARKTCGMTSAILPLRLCVDPAMTFGELIEQATTVIRQGTRRQRYAEADLRRDLGLGPNDEPPYAMVLNVVPFTYDMLFGNQEVRVVNLGNWAINDLQLVFHDRHPARDLCVELVGNADNYAAAANLGHLQRFTALFPQVLGAGLDTPLSQIDLLNDAERGRILVDFNQTDRPTADVDLVGLFENQVDHNPNAPALLLNDHTLSYGELDRASNRLARHLIAIGVSRGDLIGVSHQRSFEMITALLAVLRVGGAYVPINGDDPESRRRELIYDAGLGYMLTSAAQRDLFADAVREVVVLDAGPDAFAHLSDARLGWRLPQNAPAYVNFTSGSTGRPKGVMATRGGVRRLVQDPNYAVLDRHTRMLQTAPYHFDAATLEIWGPLLNGGVTALLPPGPVTVDAIATALDCHGINTLWLTSGLFSQVVDYALESLAGLHQLLAGGDVLPPTQVTRLLARFPKLKLINGYGPTENTTFTSCYQVSHTNDARIPIGKPIDETQVYVLDDRLEPLPVGVPGRLYTAGAGLALGYLNRPGQTALSFLPNPHGLRGDRLYDTGDRALFREDGVLEFLGRADRQVKLRGYRIEPGEIEAVILAVADLLDCHVRVREDRQGDQRLTAYVVAHPHQAKLDDLKARLASKLPDHMVPAHFVWLDALPLTAAGKLDWRALPAPKQLGSDAYAAPRNPLEATLAEIWADVLGLERVGVEDNFFEMGGHSLLGTRVMSRILKDLRVELTIRTLFEAPTIAGLAGVVAAAEQVDAGAEIQSLPRDGVMPLSFAEERLWFLNRLTPDNAFYNMPLAFRLKGSLDPSVLERVFEELVARHEILRTGFSELDGEPRRHIEALPFKIDVRSMSQAEDLAELVTREAQTPFDLSVAPLMRVTLIPIDGDDHLLLLTMHHIISDGWSVGVMFTELAALFDAFSHGRPSPLKPLAIQYADFAVWQRRWITGAVLDPQLAYWREKLKALPTLDLPLDRPRPAAASYRSGVHKLEIPAQLTQALNSMAQAAGTSLYMVLLTGFSALAARYSGQDDIALGSPIANRTRKEIESLIGFFVNTLVMRGDFSGAPTSRQMLARIQKTALDAYANQDIPFERLVEELAPERDMSRNPLIQNMFALQDAPIDDLKLPGLQVAPFGENKSAVRFDMEWHLWQRDGGLSGAVCYAVDLFDGVTIERMSRHFQNLLARMADLPDAPILELDYLSGAERRELLETCNQTASVYPNHTIHHLFEVQAAENGQRIALNCINSQISYQQLNLAANQLAGHLQVRGVKPGDHVGLCLPRSQDMIVAILAILKTGAAYVPMDASLPNQRLAFMIEDTQPQFILTQSALAKRLEPLLNGVEALVVDSPDLCDAGYQPVEIDPLSPAYIMYTSGSTGTPRGVVTPHRAVVRLVRGNHFADLTADDVMLGLAPISFDASTLELWGALLNGGVLALFPAERPTLESLGRFIREQGVTTCWLTAGLFHQMAHERAADFAAVRQVLSGGDVLDPTAVRAVLKHNPGLRLTNGYGPTENTTFTTCHTMTAADEVGLTVSIGSPIANTTVYVLDGKLLPVSQGVAGELCSGGDGLAAGYLNRPDLTALRFVPDPFGARGARLYKTGDLVRRTANGKLDFISRIDHQVKLRGYRIEPGEIEAAMQQEPFVGEARVLVRQDRGDKRLVAYVTLDPAFEVSQAQYEAMTRDQVEGWSDLFDEHIYVDEADGDPLFHITGWNSSFDGSAIPEAQMRVWAGDIVDQVLAHKPQRVLELGCGTGMLLFQLAPHCSHYEGWDISQTSLNYVRDQIEAHAETYAHVKLCKRMADELDGLAENSLDAIILSSVIQYFPNLDYLLSVIAGSIRAVKPGGAVFLADLRNHRLMRSFHTAMALFKASPGASVAEIRSLIAREMAREKEFYVDPDLFQNLRDTQPKIGAVQIRLQPSIADNEMSMFRYMAVLHLGEQQVCESEVVIDGSDLSLQEIETLLVNSTAATLTVTNLVNRRIAACTTADRLIHTNGTGDSQKQLRAHMGAAASAALDLDEIRTMAAAKGYRIETAWSVQDHARFDVVFVDSHADLGLVHTPVTLAAAGRTVQRCANNPTLAKVTPKLIEGLKQTLAQSLPAYMIPTAFVPLESLPLSVNGKLNRHALPAPEGRDSHRFVAPRTPVEQELAVIWSAVLGLDRVSVDDDFFELGGHSLLATQVVSRIRKSMGIELPIKALFESPTIAGLALVVTVADQGETSEIQVVPRDGALPMSFAQERLWFLNRLMPDSHFYNMATAVRVNGELNISALEQAFEHLIQRHETLRTELIEIDGRPCQRIVDSPDFHIKMLPMTADLSQLAKWAAAEARAVFDLGHAPLLRVSLAPLPDGDHVLMVTKHHIISDGWSVGVFFRELATLYEAFSQGKSSPLPSLTVQYADFAVWQRKALTGAVLDSQLDYWRNQLCELPILDLPLDRPRPAVATYRGAVHYYQISAELTNRLNQLARDNGASLFMTLLTGFSALAARYGGQDDVALGSPIANRTRNELEPLIGFFVNTLVMRGDFSDHPTCRQMLKRMQAVTLDAFVHQDIPFERLVAELAPERDLSRNPLVQTMFALQNAPMGNLELPGLRVTPFGDSDATVRFDMEWHLWQRDGGLSGVVYYCADLFDECTMARMSGHFQNLLSAMVRLPDAAILELDYLDEAERRELVSACNQTTADYPRAAVHTLFETCAKQAESVIALSFGSQEMRYDQLNMAANQLAGVLQTRGVVPGDFVGLCLPRSQDMIVAILAILKTGAAYVPMDGELPDGRLAFMLADTKPRFILTHTKRMERFESIASGAGVVGIDALKGAESVFKPVAVDPLAAAYVMYTSGSTGTPRGVVTPHRAVVRLVRGNHFADLTADEVMLGLAPISFDASTLELWGALLNGGRLALFPAQRPTLESLGRFIREQGITTCWLTAGLFHQMAYERAADFAGVRQVLAGGDVLDPAAVRAILKQNPALRLINGYGPTENTTFTTCHAMTAADEVGLTVPIGQPIANTTAYVLDRYLLPTSQGVAGELCSGGIGLAAGYLNRPDLTALRFVPDPFAGVEGARLYKTGDLVRRTANGLDFISRMDHQVKLRGYRIEPGEIEAAILQESFVGEARVLAREDRGDKRLVAYATMDPAFEVSQAQYEAMTRDQVEGWSDLFDEHIYVDEVNGDPLFHITGWNSSFDGSAIPEAQMRVWAADIVDQVLAHKPQRVLELGCGTGMLLFQLAPHCRHYEGWDISQTSLNYVRDQIETHGQTYAHVQLCKRMADELDGVAENSLDAIILSSVIQYFPNLDYLLSVIAGSIRAVKPGGAVFLADLRNHRLMRTFHTAMALFKASPGSSVAEIRSLIAREMAREKEFYVDPDLFQHLRETQPKIGALQIRLQPAIAGNEMSMFRYMAILHLGEQRVCDPHVVVDGSDLILEQIEALLVQNAAPTLTVTNLANRRIAACTTADGLIHNAGTGDSQKQLRAHMAEATSAALDLDEISAMAALKGYRVEAAWSILDHARFDVVFVNSQADVGLLQTPLSLASAGRTLQRCANNPTLAKATPGLIEGLRQRLAQSLPAYMIPDAFVILESLPLSVNGKLNRHALPAPEDRVSHQFVAPRTGDERELAVIWSDVLGLDKVSVEDDFFELGGHSLLATQVVSRIRKSMGIELPIKALFESPTIAGLALVLAVSDRDSAAVEIPVLPRDGAMSMSFAQERLWFLNRLMPDSAYYNMPMAVRIGGALNVPALERAFGELVNRHEPLRTYLTDESGEPCQHIVTELDFKLTQLPRPSEDSDLAGLVRREAETVFDLGAAPLMRVTLVPLDDNDHLLMVTKHHIISDGWSMGVFFRELAALYGAFAAGQASPLEPLPIQYADFAAWQRNMVSGVVLEKQLAYWSRQLQALPTLELPLDRPRPAVAAYEGAVHLFDLSADLVTRLNELTRASGTSLFMTVLTGFSALAARYSGQLDIALGSPIANRTRKEMESLIGFFVNTLVMRGDFSARPSTRQMLKRMQNTALDAFAHQDIPFERLVEELAPERDPSRNPLVQTMFALQNAPMDDFELPGLCVTPFAGAQATVRFDMEWHLWQRDGGLTGVVYYSSNLFDAVTIERMSGHYRNLLQAMAAEPDVGILDLDYLDEAERRALLVSCNQTQIAYPDKPIHVLFEEQAAAAGSHIALSTDKRRVRYDQLNTAANELAGYLQERGVVPGDCIGLCLPRSAAMITAVPAILKTGAAYVPMDADLPDKRLAFMIADTKPRFILTQSSWVQRLTPLLNGAQIIAVDTVATSASYRPVAVDPLATAYIMYTSGSTGTPRGVVTPHRAVVRLVRENRFASLTADEVILGLAPISFDASTFELWGALLNGACLALFPAERPSLESLGRFLREEKVTTCWLTAGLFHQMARERPTDFAGVTQLLAGGDVLAPDAVRTVLSQNPGLRLINGYGPTENTTFTTCHVMLAPQDVGLSVSIGSPITNTTAYVLDANLRPVALGVPGELCTGGDGLAKGYLNRPDLTAQLFVPDPYGSIAGARLYKTGDLVRRGPDQKLDFISRMDHQVKLRGYRIEPGEIEAVIRQEAYIREAVVLVRKEQNDDKQLVAYMSLDPRYEVSEEEYQALTRDQVEGWTDLFDEHIYTDEEEGDPLFRITGWNSSYDGSAIPEAQMRLWAGDIVAQVLEHQPKRVLELGCGTGMLLFQMAPHCEHYEGWDISQTSLNHVRRQIEAQGESLAHVQLHKRMAHDLSHLEENSLDAVVLSSVIQYFPSLDYLLEVIHGSIRAVRPGGAIFLADLRDYGLMRVFHTSMALFKSRPGASIAEIRSLVAREMAREKEFYVGPDLFLNLVEREPELGTVQIRLQKSIGDNEMNMFRYMAVLHLGDRALRVPQKTMCARGMNSAWIKSQFIRQWDSICFTQIANARIVGYCLADDLIHRNDTTLTRKQLQALMDQETREALTPDVLFEMGKSLGYRVDISWSAGHDSFDALFVRESALEPGVIIQSPITSQPPLKGEDLCANNPILAKLTPKLLDDLSSSLGEKLPEYMRPRAFVVLDHLPLGVTGKVDRKSLPAPDTGSMVRAEHVEPRSELELALVDIWQEVLQAPRIGVEDNFFDLGGHSLLATRVIARISGRFGLELPIRVLFNSPTIAGLAAFMETSGQMKGAEAPILRVDRSLDLPLSFTQERLWFLAQMEPHSAVFNMPAVLRLKGGLDVSALRQALDTITARHESLRTGFENTVNGPVQVIHPPKACDLTLVDLDGDESGLMELIAAEVRKPFDLSVGGLIRVRLLKCAAADHVLIITMHHIISDGWSLGVFNRELQALYEAGLAGVEAQLEKPAIGFVDYAVWQRSWLCGDVLAEQRRFWQDQLAGIPTLLELPTDKPRPAQQSFRGAIHRFRLGPDTTAKVNALCRESGASLFMTLLAAYDILLQRYSGMEDIVVGTPVAGRSRMETESLIGFFINMVALRTDLSGSDLNFRGLLERVKQSCLDAFAFQDFPFEMLVEAIQPERNLSHAPIFQTVFSVLNMDMADLCLGNLEIEHVNREKENEEYDLGLSFMERQNQLYGWFEYNTDLFEAATIQRMSHQFCGLLDALLNDPDVAMARLSLLSEAEAQRLHRDFNPVSTIQQVEPVHCAIEAWAVRSPQAVAVRIGERQLSYAELNATANRLAHALIAQGIEVGDVVAVAMGKSPETIIALTAIFKIGAVYLPLDPEHPAERLAYMIADAGVGLTLTHSKVADNLGAAAPILCLDELDFGNCTEVNPQLNIPLDCSAYIIYTSGSTGKPKGVVVSHHALAGYCCDIGELYELTADDVILQTSALNFDLSMEEILAPLSHGAGLVLPDGDIRKTADFTATATAHRVSVVVLTPAWCRMLMVDWAAWGAGPDRVRLFSVGGDVMQPELIESWRKGPFEGTRLLNVYGPTEAVIGATAYEPVREAIAVAGSVPVGRPLTGATACILDRFGQPTPIGVPGELMLGSRLASGYCGRADATAAAFIPDPFASQPGARLYRTGDRARYLADGNIEFLGRLDFQVQVRGFRIEPGEIEAMLDSHPAVRECVVVPYGDHDIGLIAYIASTAGASDRSELEAWLRERLPAPMVPGKLMFLDELPRNSSDKVDRSRLPHPERGTVEMVAPRDWAERKLAAIWCEVLGVESVSPLDNFFHLGGHSLLAVKLMRAVESAFGLNLPLSELFQYPTLEALAARLRHGGKTLGSGLVPIKSDGEGSPLFCMPGVSGDPFYLRDLGLATTRPFYGFQARGLHEGEPPRQQMEAVAADVISAIRQIQPQGPYHLAGHSFGGLVAYEAALQLRAEGEDVAELLLFDALSPTAMNRLNALSAGDEVSAMLAFGHEIAAGLGQTFQVDAQASADPSACREILCRELKRLGWLSAGAGVESLTAPLDLYLANRKMIYQPQNVLDIPIGLFRATERPELPTAVADLLDQSDLGWAPFTTAEVVVHSVAGDHMGMLKQPRLQSLLSHLNDLA